MRSFRLTTALAAAALFVASTANAQPGGDGPPPPPPPGSGPSGSGYYAQPPVGPAFQHRRGLTLGFGFGVGGMSAESGPIECLGCDYEPAAVGFDFHIGGMINPRLAILFEVWGTGQQITASGDEVLMQTMAMVALQYWATPKLWIKGGIGAAHLSISVEDSFGDSESFDIDDGAGIMGAIGYEVMSSRKFSIDLQLRVGSATYDGIQDQIQSGLFSVGFNWF